MDLDKRNQILTVLLAVIIVFLSWYLYRSITEPYEAVLEEREMTEDVRHRMGLVRDALVQYKNRRGNFPPTEGGLDSIVEFVKTDSLMVATADERFDFRRSSYNPDSLVYSPRPPHNRFEYALNDTLRPRIYLLEDPDSEDSIGDLQRTTMLNAPNWN